jgi:ABC-type transporter Mla subunit MlaD
MTRDQVDQALAALGPAYDRIAAAMFALDNHAGLAFLRGKGLTGTTGQVSRDVQGLMSMLWAQFEALRQRLERAKDVRAARSRPGDEELAVLRRLLAEPVVPLGGDGFPLDGVDTPPATPTASLASLDRSDATRRVTLAELAQGLERAGTDLADLLSEVDGAVSSLTGRLATLTDALARAEALAADRERDGEADRLTRLAAELVEVREQGLADPIEVSRGGAHAAAVEQRLSRLGADIDAARARLDELARVRDDYPRRLAGLRDAVAAVAAAEAEAGQAYEVVRAKIADPGLPRVPGAAGALSGRLSGLDALAAAGRWPELVDQLSALERMAGEARAYARRLRTAADGLLDRRTELRGRLDAYRAKTARLGHGEHTELSTLHKEAHGLLYTSPCDLPAATRAVFRYQQALADLIDPKETGT